jgi:glutathione S-transferase
LRRLIVPLQQAQRASDIYCRHFCGRQTLREKKTYEKLASQYQQMNDTLSDNGGERYLGQRSFADTFLYVLTRWIEKTPLAIKNYPTLKAHRARMEADEGVRQALQRQSEKPIG